MWEQLQKINQNNQKNINHNLKEAGAFWWIGFKAFIMVTGIYNISSCHMITWVWSEIFLNQTHLP